LDYIKYAGYPDTILMYKNIQNNGKIHILFIYNIVNKELGLNKYCTASTI